MKWLVLVVVIILTAPTIAKRLAGEGERDEKRGGIVYRGVRRYGLLRVGLVTLVAIGATAAALFLRAR